MTENVILDGIISLIVLGVVSFLIAIGLGLFYFFQTADNLYKQGNIFGCESYER